MSLRPAHCRGRYKGNVSSSINLVGNYLLFCIINIACIVYLVCLIRHVLEMRYSIIDTNISILTTICPFSNTHYVIEWMKENCRS